jgi:hypothetical protein
MKKSRNSVKFRGISRNNSSRNSVEFRRNFSQFRTGYEIDESKKNRRNSMSTKFRGHPRRNMGIDGKLVCSGEIPAVPRNGKLSEFRSKPFRRREKCSEFFLYHGKKANSRNPVPNHISGEKTTLNSVPRN